MTQTTIASHAADFRGYASPPINIVETNCRCCGAAEKELIETDLRDIEDGVIGEYNLSKCVSCTLIYLSKTPNAASLGACYPDTYYTRGNRKISSITKFLYRVKMWLRFKDIMAVIERAPDSFLEVGCGDGSFLAYLEEKWLDETKLVGTDISVGGVRLPSKSKVILIESSAESLNLDQQFDVIAMHQVLEHLPNPVEGLRRIADCLKPSGILIGEVPNWDSPWRRIFPRHWGGLQIPRHQSFFQPLSLETTLRAAGFRLERIDYTSDPGDLGVTLCNWIADALRLKTPPRQLWFFFPLLVASAPVVFLQTVIFARSGGLSFKARKTA